jgi:uncharacterized protein YgiM (DUF1202 family)
MKVEVKMYTKNLLRTMLFSLITLVFLASAFVPMMQAKAASDDTAFVSVSKLNLRKGPGLTYEVMQLLDRGDELTVLEVSSDKSWSKVETSDGKIGWVYNLYLQAGNAEPSEGTVIVDLLNLRVGPGSGYRIVEVLELGDEVSVLGRSLHSDWLEVEAESGKGGWVFSPFVAVSKDLADLPVREAYGGATGSPVTQRPLDIIVTIRDNKAVVDINNFPANEDITAELGLAGEDADMEVAEGKTDGNGSARLTFDMPKKLSNGDSVKSGNFRMVVFSNDSSFSRAVSIVYVTYQ